jgi:tRNA-binding protein
MSSPPKDSIVYDDFAKVDMRVGEIKAVEPFPRARNPSYKVQVDFGSFGTRWSSAQITSYQPQDLIGRQVICVVNMPPRNIAGFQSEVLILGAENSQGEVIVLTPQATVPLGQPIY